MNIVYFLLPLALFLGLSFLGAFVYFSWRGQFDDLDTPAHRILLDDDEQVKIINAKSNMKGSTT